jgi:hypothetical protein
MPTPPLPDAVLEMTMTTLGKVLGHQGKAAKALGISRQTVQHRMELAKARGITGEKPRVRVPVRTDTEDAGDPIEKRAALDEVASLRRRTTDLERQIIEERRWRRQFESLGSLDVTDAPWLNMPAVRRSASHIVQLFTSDFQCGEVVRASEIDGINEYNHDIFIERYQTMIDKTIELATEHTGATTFDGCVYLGGGDAINGEIHEELADTNDLSSIPAVRLVCRQQEEGIRRLRDKFGSVRVYLIAGNHGRTTHKPRSNSYTDKNFETLLNWWLASRFDNDPRVQFFIPSSGFAYYDVMGWKFLLAHGDRMGSRGGTGNIGPVATNARGHAKLYNNYSRTGRPVDWILTGHLHSEFKLSRGFANGALVGYNAYARDLMADPDAARQWMFLTHEHRPIAQEFSIQLSPMPRRTEMVEHSSKGNPS